ncbi:P-loop containing nucleoside triphosphate hydrolase protein [Wallemia mellicola]|nr:P-loop containing nucleoside triphosphate hydrolase protein [Wallemia mellicola]TIC48971.1 P-loop containing nucleoside triphosphate hydrolase protein [Wallemia mellicola]
MENPFVDEGNHLVDIDKSKEVYRKLSKQLSRDDNKDISNTVEDSSEVTLNEYNKGRFNLRDFLSNDKHQLEEAGKTSNKHLGLAWKGLRVNGAGGESTFVKTFPEAVLGTFGPDVYNFITGYFPKLDVIGKKTPIRPLIHDFTGALGNEMMLVLGKPGSGCTTFLKALANRHHEYVSVEGDLTYGGLSPQEVKDKYRGEIVMNTEEDLHYPTLTVAQTLEFAIRQKVPRIRPNGMKRSEYVKYILDALLKIFGIEHTANTVVGNDFIRGVSGGERKRVSIAETLVTRASVMCWDNSTRGLDATTAVDYVRSLRIITDITGGTSIATLYQAGEGIYELFDKVCVVDEGRCIYYGPANEACSYFESIGFYKPPRQTSADFLTSVTDIHERTIKPGWEGRAPRTSEELEKVYKDSQYYQAAVASADQALTAENNHLGDFKTSVREDKKRRMAKTSPYTVSFIEQIYYCLIREIQLQKSQISALRTKFATILFSALTISSLFYDQSGSGSVFAKGSVCFFSTVFVCWVQLSEVWNACMGREIIAKQSNEFAFYHPSAVTFATFLVDVPVIVSGILLFSIVVYFLGSLDYTAGKFFTYFCFVSFNAVTFNQLYKAVASMSSNFTSAIRYNVCLLSIAFTLVGYTIPRYNIGNWFRWISWVNPLPYNFESLLVNQFHGVNIECDQSDIVPNGVNGAEEQYQSCGIQGNRPGSLTILGDDYVDAAFDYKYSHLWNNLGYISAFLIGYLIVTAVFTEYFNHTGGKGGVTVFAKTDKGKSKAREVKKPGDIESGLSQTTKEKSNKDIEVGAINPSDADFTFKNVSYTVTTAAGEKRLLDNITGYVKPGTIMALMGASGAGKTTLLNTLSQRMATGVITGDMLIDGKPLELNSFQRGTGFVLQGDLHDAFATVRESIEFSAILRQPRETPRDEVLAYVDKIIDLLELKDLEDAIIGSPEAGLGVEQRKRVTIAVELAAKPDVLLFLDEPTSGLDSQSAYSIGRFLNKLADTGQAILCTIHQPSSLLFTEFFDRLLLLAPGGKVVYQGPVGDNGSAIVDYFKRIGARECQAHENVAEYAIEMIAYGCDANGEPFDFVNAHRISPEAAEIEAEVNKIIKEKSKTPKEQTKAMTRTYSQSFSVQLKLLIQRMSRNYWRDSSYAYGQLFITVSIAILNGFIFFKTGTSIQNMTERSFSAFLVLLIPPFSIVSAAPKFFINYEVFKSRENLSRVYSWYSFVTAYLLCELPYAFINAIVYWVIWYWPIAFSYTSEGDFRLGSPAGLTFLLIIEAFIFTSWLAAWMCTMSPNAKFTMDIMPFIIILLFFVNGIFIDYAKQPVFWEYFMYYVNPYTYLLGGIIGATASNVEIQCSSREITTFSPPSGETCLSYAGAFVERMGGYLLNGESTGDCQYCPMSNSSAFLDEKHIFYSTGWPWGYFGIFTLFSISSFALTYLFFYITKVNPPNLKLFKKLSLI